MGIYKQCKHQIHTYDELVKGSVKFEPYDVLILDECQELLANYRDYYTGMSKGKQKYTPFKFLDYGVLCIMMTGTVTQDIDENIPREIGIEIH